MKLKKNVFRNFIKKVEGKTDRQASCINFFFFPFGKKEELGRIWGGGMA